MTDFCLCPRCHRSFTLAVRYLDRQLAEDDAITCPHCLRRFDPFDRKPVDQQKRERAMDAEPIVKGRDE